MLVGGIAALSVESFVEGMTINLGNSPNSGIQRVSGFGVYTRNCRIKASRNAVTEVSGEHIG